MLSAEWLTDTLVHWNICALDRGQNAERVVGSVGKSGIAIGCADTEEVQVGVLRSQDDGEGVLRVNMLVSKPG